MNTNRAEMIDTIRIHLSDPDSTTSTWADIDINTAIDRVLSDINVREPKLNHTLLPIQNSTKAIDLSSLTGLIDVISVEYPFGEASKALKGFRIIGNALILDLPDVVNTDEKTLTGTVIFTEGSFNVSGSVTVFSTEISAGDYIKKSTDVYWNRVAYVDSDTSLILDMPFEGTTGADTLNSTKARAKNDCAMVNWTSPYMLDITGSALPRKIGDLVISGAVAHCLNLRAISLTDAIPIGAGAVGNYVSQADRAMAIYQAQLRRLGRIEDTMVVSFPAS